MVIIVWAIFCFIKAIYGWQQYSIVANDVPPKLLSSDLQTDKEMELDHVPTYKSFLTGLTPLENAASKEVTKLTINDNTYEYNNLVLTTVVNVFHNKISTADFNITQKHDSTEYVQRIINERNTSKKKQFIDGFHKSDITISESISLETSTDEYQYRVHTPARRIFHGHKTKIKHFPFLVTVHVLGRFVCGGTIIKSDLVLTAAACLKRWQEWVRRHPTTHETTTQIDTMSTDINTQSTIDLITTDVTAPSTIDSNTTDMTAQTITDTITTDLNVQSTIDTITTAVDVQFTIDTTNTDGNGSITANVADEIGTTTFTKNKESSEDSGISSSYETTAKETSVTIETPPTEPSPGVLSVRIGTNYYRLGGKVVHVVDVYFHPSYNEENFHNNLAIMRLERRLKLKGRRVRKININPAAVDLPENSSVTVAGWGAKTYYNKVYNGLWNLIHKAVMKVSPLDQCVSTYNETVVTATNFCALNEHHEGACKCDAGNPAVADGQLVGIVSFGPRKCGAWDSPTVFTNIGFYTEWIQKIRSITVPKKDQSSSSSSESNSSETTTTDLTTHNDLT